MGNSRKAQRRLEKRFQKNQQSKNDLFSSNPPTALEPTNDEDDFVAFSFQDLHKDYGFNTSQCNHQLRLDLLSKLRVISCKSWNDLEKAGKKSGFESLPINALRKPIPEDIPLKGVNKLHVLRFNGQDARLIGYRLGRVFYIIFIDPELEVYNH